MTKNTNNDIAILVDNSEKKIVEYRKSNYFYRNPTSKKGRVFKNEEMLEMFYGFEWKVNHFDKLTKTQLKQINKFISLKFKSSKNRYGINKTKLWLNDNKIDHNSFIQKLNFFTKSLENKKINSVTLKIFVLKINESLKQNPKQNVKNKIELNNSDSQSIRNFLAIFLHFKNQYFDISKNELSEIIHSNFELNLKKSTIRNKIYEIATDFEFDKITVTTPDTTSN